MNDNTPPKLAYQINDAAKALGISRSHLYVLIKRGDIAPGRIAGRVVIRTEELRRYFETNFKQQDRG